MSAPAVTKIGLNTLLPSIRRIHSMIRDKNDVEVKLVTGDQLRGKIIWIDDSCICLDTSGHKLIIWQQAIAFIKN
jgi:host factor-I protein